MYPTNDTYKEKVKELDRVWELKVDIEHEKGTLNLTDKDIALGGLNVTEKTQPGEDFTVGGTVASDLSLKILNRTGGGNLLKNSKGDFIVEPRTTGDASDNYNYYTFTADMEIGQTYTFSADIEITHGEFDKVTVYIIDMSSRIDVPIDEYGRIKRTFTVDREGVTRVLVYAGSMGSTRGNGIIISHVKLELGDQATPWEDDYSDIDFTGAKIKPYVMLTEDDEGRNLLKRTTDKYQSIDTGTWFNRLNEYPKALNPIEDFGLQVGDTIVYRLYLKTNVDVGAVARLTFYSDDNYSDKTIITGNVISENSEGYSSVVVTLTEKMKYIDVNIQNGKAGEINSNIVEYKKPKLEKGDTATDWRPAVEDWSEPIPLGIFNVDTQSRFRSTIELKAMDNMIKMDRPYSYSKLSYPATLYQIYVDVCSTCNLLPATHNFLHKDLLIKNRPEGDLSCRDILGFVAQLSGSFAKITRDGKVALKWYEPTDLELGPMNRFEFKPSDEQISITGVMYKESDEKIYLAGTDEYAIDLTENPLLQQDYAKVLPAILDKIKDVKFNPYTSKWQGDPSVEAGDMVKHIDVDGNEFNTIITGSTYKYRQAGNIEAKAKSKESLGYKGSNSKKLANAIQTIKNARVEIEDQLTSVEQAQLNATEMLANMLGGHLIQTDEAIYIADNTNVDLATRVWMWGINGFAYYPNGLDNPPSTAITADNSIVAMLVAANIITADMVRTGLLQSENGELWINLDNGYFNLKNIIYDDKGFRILYKGEELETSIDNLASGLELIENRTTNNEVDIKSLKDEVSFKVSKEELENLRIGGRNLLRDSQRDIMFYGDSANVVFIDDAEEPFYRATGVIDLYTGFPEQRFTKDLNELDEVTVSLEVRSTRGSIVTLEGNEFDIPPDKWTKIWVTKTFTGLNSNKYTNVFVPYNRKNIRAYELNYKHIEHLTSTGDNLDYRNLQFEEGNKATSYSSAPEDLDINNIKRNVTELILTSEGLTLDVNSYNEGKLKGMTYDFDGERFEIGGTDSNNRTLLTNDIIQCRHDDGSFSQMSHDGFKRFLAGKGKEYHYLLEVGKGAVDFATAQRKITIQLPEEFKGKNFQFFCSLVQVGTAALDVLNNIHLQQRIVSHEKAQCEVSCWASAVEFDIGTHGEMIFITSGQPKGGLFEFIYLAIA